MDIESLTTEEEIFGTVKKERSNADEDDDDGEGDLRQ